MMENGVLVFILTVIGSFVLMYGFGSLFGGDDIEFTYVFMFILQSAFTTAILFQILHKVKKLENREGEKESREG